MLARKRAAASAFRRERKRWSRVKGNRPDRDPAYLAFLRTLPCLLCVRGEQCTPTEAAHLGPHGISQKAPDYDAIPLCGGVHHREGRTSASVLGRRFLEFHGIDHRSITQEMRARFNNQSLNGRMSA